MPGWNLEYSIDVDEENSVVYAKIHGRWSAKTAESYHDDFKAELETLMGRPWARLIDLTNWKTSRDEVTEVIGRHMAWCRQNDISLSLYVINNTSTFRQLNEMFAKGGTKHYAHTFRTYAEAEKYLKENWLNKQKK